MFLRGAVPFRTPFPTSIFTFTSALYSFFFQILRDGRGLCPEVSAALCRHGHRKKESTTMSGCADELHPKYPGRWYSDVTTVYSMGFCDVIYWLVKITSLRKLHVIYGVNRNVACPHSFTHDA